jgi:hypothetical protein
MEHRLSGRSLPFGVAASTLALMLCLLIVGAGQGEAAGCTPTTSVLAKSGQRAVTFTVRGGM